MPAGGPEAGAGARRGNADGRPGRAQRASRTC